MTFTLHTATVGKVWCIDNERAVALGITSKPVPPNLLIAQSICYKCWVGTYDTEVYRAQLQIGNELKNYWLQLSDNNPVGTWDIARNLLRTGGLGPPDELHESLIPLTPGEARAKRFALVVRA